MRLSFKKFLLVGALPVAAAITFTGCSKEPKTYNFNVSKPTQVYVDRRIASDITVTSVDTIPKKDGVVIQFSVKNEGASPQTFAYKVVAYDAEGMLIDFPTNKWVVANIDPYEEKTFQSFIPVNENDISKVSIKIKPLEQTK